MRVVVVHGHRDPGRIMISHECVRRVDCAQRVKADVVIFSGAGMRGEQSEAAQMDACWQGADLPTFLDTEATSTVENAERGSSIARSMRAVEVTVVTSWWHVPRSWLAWKQRGAYKLKVRAARGSWRYVPGELAALWRAVRTGG